MPPEREAKLVQEMNRAMEGPTGPAVGTDEADFVAIHRIMPVRMGKWQIIEQAVAERSIAHQQAKRVAAEPTGDDKP
jgi:hypothetical protein